MKILHTSDWHLGKKLYRLERTEEHRLFFKWLLEIIKEEKIDLLVISGDIFDSPNPPHEAQDLYYDFLHRFSSETECCAYIISGNHDSGTLLEAPKALLAFHRIHVCGKLSPHPEHHWKQFEKHGKKLDILMLPFFRSWELMANGETGALERLQHYFKNETPHPKILIMHHLVGIIEAAGSEHVISLSGLETIPPQILNDFSYVALGHIHKPQKVASNAHYSGSPLPMRFSEKNSKSVVLINLDENQSQIKIKPIPVFRELFQLKLEELNWREEVEKLSTDKNLKGIAEIEIQLSSPKVGISEEIKEILSKKNIELLSFSTLFQEEANEERYDSKMFGLGPVELFQEFYLSKYPQEKKVPEDVLTDFKSLVERANNEIPQAKN
jgi:exonuclease SbcD